MSKFIEKLIKLLAKVKGYDFIKKFLDFIVEVFGGKNGEILDKLAGLTNNCVKSVELFEQIYKEKLEVGFGVVAAVNVLEVLEEVNEINPQAPFTNDDLPKLEELGREIEKAKSGINFADIPGVITNSYEKGESKFKLVRNIVIRDLEKNGIEYTVALVGLAIQSAVVRFYGKK